MISESISENNKINVLCLHGYLIDGKTFNEQLHNVVNGSNCFANYGLIEFIFFLFK
jgi:hypothetical protein